MVNFWSHLITGKASKISCTLFHIIKDKIVSGTYTSKWLTEVENTLHKCGLSYILNTPTSQILPRSIKLLVKDKIGLMENQDWQSRIFESSVCVNYRLFKSKGPATRCDATHPRRNVTKTLRCIKIACDALRCIFQHVGSFAPDNGISQLFIVRFSNGFQHDNGHLMSFLMMCDSNFSVKYFLLPSQL